MAATAEARLYVSDTAWDPANTCADYVEASFVGYAPIDPIFWQPPFINANGAAETDSQVLTWFFLAGVGGATVYGVYVTDPLQTKLLLVLPFVSGYRLTPATNTLSIVIQLAEISEL